MIFTKRERESSSRLLGSYFAFALFSLSIALGMGVLISHSAYAASYVNVSSGGSGETAGVVSLGKIKPSSSGSTATGNDALTVHTDCSAGYKVYVSGQNGKTTNLTNQSATDPTNPSSSDIISASSGTIASPAVLSANTWGISGSSTDIENHLYAGLPAYADATNVALVTKTNVEEESTVPIYYGVNANTAINPGTYKGDILYTVLMDSSCVPYTVEFNPNVEDESEITGEMESQSILPNSPTALTANAYKRSGYAFLGWSESADGKTGNVTNGIGTEDDVDYENEEEVENLAVGGSSITLYAIWGDLGGDMQGWTGCSKMSDGDTTELTDLRDGTVYEVKKFGDECWMTENLILGHDKGYALTSELTNIPSNDDGTLSNNGTYYLPQAGHSGNLNDPSPTHNVAFFDSSMILSQAQVQYRAQGSTGDQSSSGTLGQNTGYYNFYATTLGCSYYKDGNSGCRSDYVVKDICPKGWQLPAGGSNATKSWVSLDKALNGSSAGSNRTDAAALGNFLDRAGFLYSGEYTDQSLYGLGSFGRWWSSTTSDNGSYVLLLSRDDAVYPQNDYVEYMGYAVRCVAQDTVTIAFDANGGTGEMNPQKLYENDVTLKSNTFARDGYTFLGWSEDANATTATYADGASVSDLVSRGGNITLYAIWAKIDGDMQGWLGCGKMSVGDATRLRDTRDNKIYTVKKLPDGKCWMMQNLTIGSDGAKTLTPADTNIDNNTTYYLPPAGKQGSSTIDNSSTLTATTTANFTNNSSTDAHAKTQFRTKDTSVTNDSDTGYYNFYTATLGFSYYQDGKSSGTSTRDICPKGWRMPKTTDSGTNVTTVDITNDFTYLARQYNSSTGWNGSATGTNGYGYYNNNNVVKSPMYLSAASPLATETPNNYAGFSYAGHWNSTDSSASNVGSYGYYWSASVYSTYSGYHLDFSSSNVYPQNGNNKSNGFAVRCVNDIDGVMQDFDSSTLTNIGDSAKLMDSRDGKVYTVKKLSDGKVWMIDNLTISATGMVADSLDNTNTNIPSSDTNKYYLPPQNMRNDTADSITSSDTKTANTAVNFDTSYSNQPQVGYRAKNTTDNNTGNAVPENTAYYNFYTASLGYSYYSDGKTSGSTPRDICPKGWRLPFVSDNGTNITAASSEFANLARSYNSSAGWNGSGVTNYSYYTSDSTIRKNMVAGDSGSLDRFASNGAAGFTYAGSYEGTKLNYVGTLGLYWSSSVYNTNCSYSLFFDTMVYPQYFNNKNLGGAVRCIAGTR